MTHTQGGTQNLSFFLWWRVCTPPFVPYLPHSRVLTSPGKELAIFVPATQMTFPGHWALWLVGFILVVYIYLYTLKAAA